MSSPDNYSRIVLYEGTVGFDTIITLRTLPSPNHSWNRWPEPADVRDGTVYGEGQFHQQEYLTGTMSVIGGGGGTVVYTFVG